MDLTKNNLSGNHFTALGFFFFFLLKRVIFIKEEKREIQRAQKTQKEEESQEQRENRERDRDMGEQQKSASDLQEQGRR